ncbi:MAG: 2-oxo acid dehydrogenase subunit E2 [Chitinophagales bacterium]|nr:2-oxo acid dehydrogenase subunit E2 [Chitinophagales bacterium]MDW8419804.1 dihydrolipoamide acetyltransferase family protein [Chitinophagales bacterium]
MAEAIRLGRMTDTMEEGFIAELHIKTGDKIKVGDVVAEVETDKATLPLESYYAGVVLHVAAKKGDTLKIGDLIAIVGKEGEDYTPLLQGGASASAPANTAEAKPEKKNETNTQTAAPVQTETPAVTVAPASGERIKASPLARMIAKERGINLATVKGSGEDGRIVKRDLEKFTAQRAPAAHAREGYRDVRVSQMRKAIARRLSESKFSAPHFYLTIDVSMDNAVSLRTQLNIVLPEKISYNDIVIKAVAVALRQNPSVNCSWLGETIRYYDHIHIGMAVAVEEGLLVPVIRFADTKTVQEISAEAKALARKATEKKLMPQEMEGNTFTISNLGMFGIEEFTAIINPPDACILAVGAIRQEPAVIDGNIRPAHRMKMTLSCDHRVVDGATGAKFLQTLKTTLENPVSILL